MSVLTSSMATLLDIARRMDPNGQIADVAEILQQQNEMLDDIMFKQGNTESGEQITIRTSKPTPSYRLLNEGVVPVKSTSGQITETCAIMETRSHVDVDIAKINGNEKQFRYDEDSVIIQSMMDQLASDLIYGDVSVNPERFNGLASRYFSFDASHLTSSQMIDAGGTGSDNTSVWLVCWGPQTIYGIVPKGSAAGLQTQDEGIQSLLTNTSTGAYMRAYVSWFQWKVGIAIKDYRSVVRICNIDISDLETSSDATDTSCNLLKLMSQAIDKLPKGVMGKKVFYMNERVRSMLRVKMQDKSNVYLTLEEVKNNAIPRPDGVLKFQGIPCRLVEAILNTESAIS